MCVAMLLSLASPFAHAASVTLEVLNPKGEIEAPVIWPLAPRLDSLNGKRIMFVGYGKDINSNPRVNYAGSVADLLTDTASDWYTPGVSIVSTGAASGLLSDVVWEKGVDNYDAWARGTGATGTAALTPPGVDAIIIGVAN